MMRCASIVFALSVTGCVQATYTDPDGRSVTYLRVGSTEFEGLTVNRDQNGSLGVEMSGFRSDGSDLVEAATRGAVQGVAGGLVP